MAYEIDTSKLLIVVVVYLAFLLDNILLTVVVPIIPDYLFATNAIVNNSETSNNSIAPKSLSQLQLRFEQLEKEYGPVGVLLSSKALVQLVANPVVGYLTGILGYNIPLVVGSTNLLVACLLFAYGQSYMCLLVARSLHGIASACVAVSGMSLVAELYQSSTRSRFMGLILGSVALGVLFGYPMGGVLYDFVGKTAPFIVIAVLMSMCIVLQICFLDITFPPRQLINKLPSYTSTSDGWRELLTDPPVTIISGAIWISTTAMAVLEPCLPLWMMVNMNPTPEKWQLGTVFIPDSLGYLLGTNCTGILLGNMKRWKLGLVSMLLVGVCSTLIPGASTVKQLIIPHFGLGLGIGILDASLVPLLANIVDSKHSSQYGAVYALQQVAVSMAYSLGPLLGGETIKVIGFPWLMRLIGIINIIYCPMLLILSKDEERELVTT
ncbi:portabella [Carabus blaptoides fortunei]